MTLNLEAPMKLKHILIFTVIILILSGCWSRKELNELAIVSTLSLDKIEDRYKVTAQVLNVNELAGAEQTTRLALAVYEEEGDTIFEAIRNITQHSPRKLYLSHLRLVIIGEELAKEGIKNALDFLARDHELRMDYFLTISKTGEASKLLKILTPIERIPAQKIYNTIEVSEAVWAPTSGVQMDEFLMKMTSLGGNPILTIINYKGDLEKGGKIANVETVNSDTELIIGNLAAFKGDKFAGRLGIRIVKDIII